MTVALEQGARTRKPAARRANPLSEGEMFMGHTNSVYSAVIFFNGLVWVVRELSAGRFREDGAPLGSIPQVPHHMSRRCCAFRKTVQLLDPFLRSWLQD